MGARITEPGGECPGRLSGLAFHSQERPVSPASNTREPPGDGTSAAQSDALNLPTHRSSAKGKTSAYLLVIRQVM